MPLPKAYPKLLFYLFIFLIQQIGISVVSQTKEIYFELDLYRQTLTPEHINIYQKALKNYYNTPPIKERNSENEDLDRRYQDVENMSDTTLEQTNLKTDAFYSLSQMALKKRCIHMELESLLQAFTTAFWAEFPNYYKAFEMAILLERKLSNTSEKEYIHRRTAYFKMGEAYYLFNDFYKSIELLKYAISSNPPRSFTDCTNLDARKIIGICYANINRMDTSDYYFQSTLESTDIVLNRPVYNAIALSHLACNAMLKGEYEKALSLDLEVLPFLKEGNNYGHIAGMYACQCFSYFGLKESSKIAILADSILYYAEKDTYNKYKRLKQAYTILAKYNTNQGKTDKAQEYNDSLINIYKREEKLYNSAYITHAKQEIAANDIAAEKAESETRQQIILIISVIFILSFIALSVISVLYRHKQAAYKALVKKNHEWANSREQIKDTFDPGLINSKINKEKFIPMGIDEPLENISKEDLTIMSRIFSYVVGEKQYTSSDFNMEILSNELGINRKYLSKAINNTTGKNFNTYVNEYRVKEAIRLLSDPANKHFPVDDIGILAGFSSRSSFYEAFRKIAGISPSEFKKHAKNISGF